MDIGKIAQGLVDKLLADSRLQKARAEGVELLYAAIVEEAKKEQEDGQGSKPANTQGG